MLQRGMSSVGPRTPPPNALSCAVCVVGQLARLELESKVRHTLALLSLALALTLALQALALSLALAQP